MSRIVVYRDRKKWDEGIREALNRIPSRQGIVGYIGMLTVAGDDYVCFNMIDKKQSHCMANSYSSFMKGEIHEIYTNTYRHVRSQSLEFR